MNQRKADVMSMEVVKRKLRLIQQTPLLDAL
jgi:hypothetical protein